MWGSIHYIILEALLFNHTTPRTQQYYNSYSNARLIAHSTKSPQHFMVQSEPENHRPFASQFNGYQILFQRRTKVSDIRFKFNLFCNHKKPPLCMDAYMLQSFIYMVEMGWKKILGLLKKTIFFFKVSYAFLCLLGVV